MDRISAVLAELLKDVRSLPEDRMRLRLIGARLSGLSPEEIADVLSIVYESGRESAAGRKLKGVLVDPDSLREILGKELYMRVYMASIELGHKKISRLFTDLPPHKTGLAGYDKEEEVKMEVTTLGQRRALSKTNVKDSLDRLLSDPDKIVITNILNNPRITEKDVLKIASKRPNAPSILKVVATHARWSKRYSVIKAVVFNPYSPPRLALGLMEFLMRQDLKLLAGDKTIHPQIRMCAKEMMLKADVEDN